MTHQLNPIKMCFSMCLASAASCPEPFLGLFKPIIINSQNIESLSQQRAAASSSHVLVAAAGSGAWLRWVVQELEYSKKCYNVSFRKSRCNTRKGVGSTSRSNL